MEPTGQTPQNKEDQLSRWLLLFGLLLVAAALILYSRYQRTFPGSQSAANAPASAAPAAPPAIRGQPAADFALPNLDGKAVRLADFEDKVVLVNFWATWCSPCLIELPWFIEFQKKYGPQGLAVLAISLDEEGPKVVKPFVEKHKMESLTVVMGDDKTADLFGGLLGLPTTFMVDREGKYYSKHQGLVSKDVVEEELLTLLKVPSTQQASSLPPSAAAQPPAASPASKP